MIDSLNEKRCRKCAEVKPRTSFVKTESGKKHWCSPCRKVARKEYYAKTREHQLLRLKERRIETQSNPVLREKRNQRNRLWRKLNHKQTCAKNIKYKLGKLQRIPKWADLKRIEEIYKSCPEGYHVDHIVPLQGKIVSGLHVENNLQYLTAEENCKKGNKFAA